MTSNSDTPGQALRIEIHGVPRAQPRGRHVGGRVVSTTGPAVRWRRLVREAAIAVCIDRQEPWMAAPPILFGDSTAVEFVVLVRFPTKVAELWGQWRTAVRDRDADNLAKICMDACVDAGLMADDGQVARLIVESEWSKPEVCGAVITVRALKPREAARIDAGGAPEWLGS